MASSNNTKAPAKKQNKKDDFEDILDELNINENKKAAILNVKPPRKVGIILDIDKIAKEANTRARDYVYSLVRFYVPDTMRSLPFVRKKIQDDIHTMTDMIIQMKTSEFGIMKMIEMANNGESTSKHYESLAKLQSSKMEILKHYESLKIVMENNYKGIIKDYTLKQDSTKMLEGKNQGSFGQISSPFTDDISYEIIKTEHRQITQHDKVVLPNGVALAQPTEEELKKIGL